MPSSAYRRWITTRANALSEIVQAHAAIGGTGPGRRYATLQVNQAYAVLLASQFQGFCRDLHSECVDHLVAALGPPSLQPVVWAELTRGRQLDRSNAQPSSIGADFGRLGVDLWTEVENANPRHATRKLLLEELNTWRNAIAHQDFDPARLGGTTTLLLARVRRWRSACHRLARAFDEVMRRHLQALTGTFEVALDICSEGLHRRKHVILRKPPSERRSSKRADRHRKSRNPRVSCSGQTSSATSKTGTWPW